MKCAIICYCLLVKDYIGDEDKLRVNFAMATHSTVGEFTADQEDWQAYVERLQQYFAANDVDDAAKQRAILLSSVGSSTYRLLRNLMAPAKPKDCTFKQIVDAIQAHY